MKRVRVTYQKEIRSSLTEEQDEEMQAVFEWLSVHVGVAQEGGVMSVSLRAMLENTVREKLPDKSDSEASEEEEEQNFHQPTPLLEAINPLSSPGYADWDRVESVLAGEEWKATLK